MISADIADRPGESSVNCLLTNEKLNAKLDAHISYIYSPPWGGIMKL